MRNRQNKEILLIYLFPASSLVEVGPRVSGTDLKPTDLLANNEQIATRHVLLKTGLNERNPRINQKSPIRGSLMLLDVCYRE
jgi:hypothetical protein